jgi:hypothetical protein
MNGSIRNFTSAPTESCITCGTEHLIAPLELCNNNSTFGAITAIARKQTNGRNFVWITSVFTITGWTFQIVAIGTTKQITEAAFPGRAKKSFTVFCGTGFNKRSYFARWLCPCAYMFNSPVFIQTVAAKAFHNSSRMICALDKSILFDS